MSAYNIPKAVLERVLSGLGVAPSANIARLLCALECYYTTSYESDSELFDEVATLNIKERLRKFYPTKDYSQIYYYEEARVTKLNIEKLLDEAAV
jgi:hypothetical protein